MGYKLSSSPPVSTREYGRILGSMSALSSRSLLFFPLSPTWQRACQDLSQQHSDLAFTCSCRSDKLHLVGRSTFKLQLHNVCFCYLHSAVSHSAVSHSAVSHSAVSHSAVSHSAVSHSAVSHSAVFSQGIVLTVCFPRSATSS
ncbi:hypothetical protein HBI80_213410 [Parastagonospora nodorum]|nr:hypothetical protein HBH47_189960 [Parastagonospora nodorum]KAH4895827.1 hypothetical protein HBI80_213410 [Parastagonospora nodorum]